MTPEEVREAGQLMIDWASEKFEVEEACRYDTNLAWVEEYAPEWDWRKNTYRRKPTPKLRPYTAEECLKLLGQKFLAPNKQVCEVIAVHAWRDTIELTLQDSRMGFSVSVGHFLETYTHPDGSLCGVEE
jgi:hypothetical protein